MVTAAMSTSLPEWLQGPPPSLAARSDIDGVIANNLDAASGRYQGLRLYYNGGIYGDIIGLFFGLLLAGSYDKAHELQEGVCAAWRAMPANGPFTGKLSIEGQQVSLDKMCGVQR
jgi:hypothetical protein